jgi:ethanolamine ammonia-lyase small subunit
MTRETSPAVQSQWARLRQHTPARIGLTRTGSSLTTHAHLCFRRDHALARDAVHDALDPAPILNGLRERQLRPVHLHSAAADRSHYLARPDLGRRLDDASRAKLIASTTDADIAFVLADGLSARAVAAHALPLIDLVLPALRRERWTVAPVAVVEQARVAVGDEIGAAVNAALVAVLIGERPGLSSPDSLGVYLTWAPRVGRKDAERNCLSNIRPEGLSYEAAAAKMLYLLTEARRRKLTGIMLKEEAQTALPAPPQPLLKF